MADLELRFSTATALRDAIRRDKLDCEMLPSGATVQIDEHAAYEPDALVYCGERLSDDAMIVPAPVIVAHVLSPPTGGVDLPARLVGYLRVASIQHVLLLDGEYRLVVHHARGQDEVIATRIVTEGALDLTPPGLTVPIEELFAQV